MPFWSHPTHATKGYRQWCGCSQPLAPLVSPGGGLGPRCCATCASASGDFPPWQSRRTLTRFSTSLQNNTCGRSKDASTEVCPIGAYCGKRPWLCHGSGAAPSRPRRTMRNATSIRTCLQNPHCANCRPRLGSVHHRCLRAACHAPRAIGAGACTCAGRGAECPATMRRTAPTDREKCARHQLRMGEQT